MGYEKDIYRLQESTFASNLVDEVWREYEGHIPEALEEAADFPDQILKAKSWIVLVNLIAGLFVRAADYEDDDEDTLWQFFGEDPYKHVTRDNTNMKRLMDYQFLSSVLLFCRWSFARLVSGTLTTNDNGYCFFKDIDGRPAIAVPLRPDLVVLVSPGPGNLRAWWDGAVWRIEGFNMFEERSEEPVHRLNRALALKSRRDVYARTEASAREALQAWASYRGRPGRLPGPGFLYTSPTIRRRLGERILHLAAVFANPPDWEPPWLLRFDTKQAWAPSRPDDRGPGLWLLTGAK